jgi:putative Mg2+ transporter-C (MgtC) family protein
MPAEWLMVASRLGASVIAGSAIGLNRKLRRKPVGIRTHALVSLGAATFVYVSLGGAGLTDNGGPGLRTVQGVVTGIGFLGAGVILRPMGTKKRISGLTTASGLWFTASLGVACGAGLYIPALIATILALIVLIIGGPLESFIEHRIPNPSPRGRDSYGRQEASGAGQEERGQVAAEEARRDTEV